LAAGTEVLGGALDQELAAEQGASELKAQIEGKCAEYLNTHIAISMWPSYRLLSRYIALRY
jgi:hypothetical protein